MDENYIPIDVIGKYPNKLLRKLRYLYRAGAIPYFKGDTIFLIDKSKFKLAIDKNIKIGEPGQLTE